MSEEIKHDRRRFLGTAAMTIAAAELGMIGSADAQSSKTNPANVPKIKPGNEHVVRLTEADRCRRPECRIR